MEGKGDNRTYTHQSQQLGLFLHSHPALGAWPDTKAVLEGGTVQVGFGNHWKVCLIVTNLCCLLQFSFASGILKNGHWFCFVLTNILEGFEVFSSKSLK